MTARVAVVLFNLGGPDRLEAVQPFLFNLFNDPAIIGAPGPIRWLLAQFISKRRAPVAREIYGRIGGKPPLRDLTDAQATALNELLQQRGLDSRVFVSMRYWHPRSDDTARDVAAFAPDAIVLLPLYPQFSTTTTGSSLTDWNRAAAAAGLNTETHTICCYPRQDGWVTAQATLIRDALSKVRENGRPRILFSAHGLPKKVVDRGDPYAWQVEQTVATVANALGDAISDYAVCYQSRVGPLEWIGPSTEEELERAAADGVSVVVVPIAFVSEHSETLVELDIEYRELAEKLGVPEYIRVPAVGTADLFVGGLADTVEAALARGPGLGSDVGTRLCPDRLGQCGCQHLDLGRGA